MGEVDSFVESSSVFVDFLVALWPIWMLLLGIFCGLGAGIVYIVRSIITK